MEDIVKQFLDEVDDFENSSLFMDDDENEPKTEWVEEIDSRTNFPFYWNSNTKESVWDKPQSYDDFLSKYESHLKNTLELHSATKARENIERNLKKQSEMRDLLGYSDSEEEIDDIVDIVDIIDNKDDIMIEDVKEVDESDIIQKELWINEEIELAMEYLHSLVKTMSETVVKKADVLRRIDIPGGESLQSIGLRVETRLEDWQGGHLTLERTVATLREALVRMSQFEGGLESPDWRLIFDKDKFLYYLEHRMTAKKRRLGNYEDGEIVEDDDDDHQEELASDLNEYVTKTLQHRAVPALDVETPPPGEGGDVVMDIGDSPQQPITEKIEIVMETVVCDADDGDDGEEESQIGNQSVEECPDKESPDLETPCKNTEGTVDSPMEGGWEAPRTVTEDHSEGGETRPLETGETQGGVALPLPEVADEVPVPGSPMTFHPLVDYLEDEMSEDDSLDPTADPVSSSQPP